MDRPAGDMGIVAAGVWSPGLLLTLRRCDHRLRVLRPAEGHASSPR